MSLMASNAVFRVATWNINSVRQRMGHLLAFLADAKPECLCLQEIKCQEDTFPLLELEAAGYHVAIVGQKTFNGVAILSRARAEVVSRSLPGDILDEQARYLEVLLPFGERIIRIACIYLPNGNPIDSEKYPYKLAFMDRLIAHTKTLLAFEEPLVLAGDYNVIPDARDAFNPALWAQDALFLPQTRAKFQSLLNSGFTDALRATSDAAGLYTFWDYQAGAWPKNNGIRIDHLLLSPQAADCLECVHIDKQQRAKEKPSDHVPVWVDLRI
jgi:exodeoxyribonuclease-3